MKLIYKSKLSKVNRNETININNILNAKKILFSVCSRYGDGIISFANKKYFYKEFTKFKSYSKIDNLYDRVREYLFLSIEKNKKILDLNLNKNTPLNIIFCPFSTDVTKNLNTDNINTIVNYFKKANIIVGLAKEKKNINVDVQKFIFKKNKKNSEDFLKLMKKSDLFIGVDSGPLHLAIALNKPSIAIFGPTAPETILNNYQKTKIIRLEKLKNTFCFVKHCKNPICIDNAIKENFLSINYAFNNKLALKTDNCPLEDIK